ncbi:phytanoyl-CoA dioxygenase [Collimonas pratensis]|uniref:phytanoyl-CoA dioxygenase family protein n=1 Tax=Collimonas pratensis TaxID=279113 RepID=UPI00143D227F|nr:phytanoyl-CoA dioxygenase family protein [Collimonas pratensis]NKI71179.1 phytanoyl-CoA dioxygenase [Collimonas pratensis]
MISTSGVLAGEQLRQYEKNGFLFLNDLLAELDLSGVYHDIQLLAGIRDESTVVEVGSGAIRAMHGSHLISEACDRLSKNEKLLAYARSILKTDVYLYQFKINMKAPFVGAVWPWHQDFIFWHHEDGMEEPNAINVVVFLDQVTEFNGPMYLIPQSHASGLIEPISIASQSTEEEGSDWKKDVSADLKYQIPQHMVFELAEAGGIVAPKGGPGSVIFFHSNLVHGSAPNISPYARRIVILTYNSTSNVPPQTGRRRPGFLVNATATPL